MNFSDIAFQNKSFLDINKIKSIFNLKGSLTALFLALSDKPFQLICVDEDECLKILGDYNFFRKIIVARELIFFPDAVDVSSRSKQVEVTVHGKKESSIVCSLDTALVKVKTPAEISSETISIRHNEEVSREDVVEFLIEFGYKNVSMVIEKGEFSLRNYVLDIFTPNTEGPVRIEFFGDEVDSIRIFSTDTQRTIKHIDRVELFPLEQRGGRKYIHEIFQIEQTFYTDSVDQKIDEHVKLCAKDAVERTIPYTRLSPTPLVDTGSLDGGGLSLNGHGVLVSERTSISQLTQSLRGLSANHKVIIVSATSAQANRVKDIFMEADMAVPILDIDEVSTWQGNMFITTGALTEGFFIEGLLVLTEKELFGDIKQKRKSSPKNVCAADFLSQMEDLSPGNYVVHEDHGVGVFEELRHEVVQGFESDMLLIRYETDARLYLPVYSLGKIKKYRAEEGILPKLDRLGGKTWQKTKARVAKRIKIAAEKLVRHYAEREVAKAHPFTPDSFIHQEFDNFFPYDETPDQLAAIEQIKIDMESSRPMDRLLCGDVGYGKTEVAMRAAFKAVYDKKKVAILVPTTILCEQHYMTFKERFSAFDVTIDYVSRFKPRPLINSTLKDLASGKIDIVIGTHGLIRKNMEIPDLGLLIIDEEHRFGVAQKERIKELKRSVHFLSLSATPIPRTLQMSLSGIWNLTTIETPPVDRQSIRTIVSRYDADLLKEALERELKRGGQVYFIHNRVRDIERIATKVREAVSFDTKVAIAHGQMKEKELEDIIVDFIKGKIDILVSTAIVGSGMDIPRANTIVINRADMMGLADLYQLRGRVGRGNLRAYAYFFIPDEDYITDTAKKRLTAINDFSYLGAGLHLAMKDMEIRGAGNLLGGEQSGHIHEIGLDTYMELLEGEVAALRGKPVKEEFEPQIDLKIDSYIPEDYIDDVVVRLNFYRRIVNADKDESLFAIKDEMADRFGKLPTSVTTFFNTMRLKLLCKALKISVVNQTKTRVSITFKEPAPPLFDALLDAQKSLAFQIKFQKEGFDIPLQEIKDILETTIDMLKRIINSISKVK